MQTEMGAAALAALEAVLLLMIEKGVLAPDDLIEALEDAAAALHDSAPCSAKHVVKIGASIRPRAHQNGRPELT